jgi:tRNA nucleotidyltransferase/poly(A) polymerase
MPAELLDPARRVAERLSGAGHGAWLVGGSVRDLALGGAPHDADLATAAEPDEIERLFARTVPVGKAFGTVLVLEGAAEVQVTTFRSETGYSDARRPDAVVWGSSIEEDAARRDFTCNAMFLDPVTDEFADPEGGLADLEAGRLRCVGEASERFAEDGLRLLRLARFAAAHDLAIEPTTLAAARANAERLQGVSAERVHDELARMSGGPAPARALGILAEIHVLERILPGVEVDLGALERLGPQPGLVLVLTALLADRAAADPAAARALLESLRPSRATLERCAALWRLEAPLREVLDAARERARAARLRLLRDPAWDDLVALQGALYPDRCAGVAELQRLREELGPEGLAPAPLLAAQDLSAAGVPRGPLWGELLREAETRQLEGELATPEEARAWLARRAQEQGGPG